MDLLLEPGEVMRKSLVKWTGLAGLDNSCVVEPEERIFWILWILQEMGVSVDDLLCEFEAVRDMWSHWSPQDPPEVGVPLQRFEATAMVRSFDNLGVSDFAELPTRLADDSESWFRGPRERFVSFLTSYAQILIEAASHLVTISISAISVPLSLNSVLNSLNSLFEHVARLAYDTISQINSALNTIVIRLLHHQVRQQLTPQSEVWSLFDRRDAGPPSWIQDLINEFNLSHADAPPSLKTFDSVLNRSSLNLNRRLKKVTMMLAVHLTSLVVFASGSVGHQDKKKKKIGITES